MPGLDSPKPSTVPRLHAYTSVWRLRADAWTSLADVTKRLADALTPTDLRAGLQARITELVLLLDPLETYWAYPGRGQWQQIGALCDSGAYESAMRLTDTVSRQLSGRDDPSGRPVFQVLVVDDVRTPEADALREEMRRLRRPEDPFSYELVIVPSFEDALVPLAARWPT
jgi:arginine decarboxylase